MVSVDAIELHPAAYRHDTSTKIERLVQNSSARNSYGTPSSKLKSSSLQCLLAVEISYLALAPKIILDNRTGSVFLWFLVMYIPMERLSIFRVWILEICLGGNLPRECMFLFGYQFPLSVGIT